MWALERAGSAAPGVLRLGEARVALDDVTSFDSEEDRTAFRHGRFLAALMFALLCGCVITGVTAFGWQWRHMLAALILACLSAMAVQDIWLANTSRMYRFRVRTRGGATIRFATADAASAAALLAVLNGTRR